MLTIVKTAALWGLEGHIVHVETDIARGLPSWNVVGLGDKIIQEAVERIKAALSNSGYDYPRQRITINLAPAGKPKEGSHFDLPVAMGVLEGMNIIEGDATKGVGFIGELSLGGKLTRIKGALPLVATCAKAGIKKIILPMQNAEEASMVKNIEIYPAENLNQVINHLNNIEQLSVYNGRKHILSKCAKKNLDFDDIKGQDSAKRAMTICAAGAHGLLMMGSPGCGKTMLAKRLPSILPDMTYDEQLEVTRLYSVAGLLDETNPIIMKRPFRAPHQNITMSALLGGGMKPMPGEFSLAHMGVLFMDEFAQFDRNIINALRQPLEEERVVVSRRGGTAVFPGKVIFIAASNPCMCGWAGDPVKNCTCTPNQLASYSAKLSGPILDRIDMRIEVPRVDIKNAEINMSSEKMRQLVAKARTLQEERYRNEEFYYNSQLSVKGIEKYCILEKDAKELVEKAYTDIPLSMRTYHRTIKLARTIADIEGTKNISYSHVAEALQYRREKK